MVLQWTLLEAAFVPLGTGAGTKPRLAPAMHGTSPLTGQRSRRPFAAASLAATAVADYRGDRARPRGPDDYEFAPQWAALARAPGWACHRGPAAGTCSARGASWRGLAAPNPARAVQPAARAPGTPGPRGDRRSTGTAERH